MPESGSRPQRQLRILIVFPDEDPVWVSDETLMRARLGAHELRFAPSLAAAGPHVADVEVVLSFTFSESLLRAAPKLRWIQGFGAGVESLMPLTALRESLIVTNARGVHVAAVPEAALAMMLALSRQLPRNVRNQELRRWQPFGSNLLSGKKLGILGVGAIGEALAQRCRALGMHTIGISAGRRAAPGFDELRSRATLTESVSDLDYLVLLLPLDDSTRGIIDARVLSHMKAGAYLINVGRGQLVDEPALLAALRSGQIAAAALDTVAREPLEPDDPLWSEPNVLITPHNAGRYDEYGAQVLRIFEYNLERYLQGDIAGMRNRLHPPGR